MMDAGVAIYIATKPVDFRKGHNGLVALVEGHLKQDPFGGAVYVFRAKRADRLKLIYWDGTGLVMTYKRLEDSSFAWPRLRDGVMRLLRWSCFPAQISGLAKVYPLLLIRPLFSSRFRFHMPRLVWLCQGPSVAVRDCRSASSHRSRAGQRSRLLCLASRPLHI